MDSKMREYRSVWFSLPQTVQNLMHGGFGGVEKGMHLFESREFAVIEAGRLGITQFTLHPCILVLSETRERVLLYPTNKELSSENPYRLQDRINLAVTLIEKCNNFKIARKAWEVRPKERINGEI